MAGDYNPYGGRSEGAHSYDDLNEHTRVSAGTPIWGWLSGTQSQVDAARAQDAAATNRSYWDQLSPPTEQQLRGPSEDRDAQMAALQQMQQWGRGGLTGADRGMMESTRARDQQAAGASRRAMSQQAQARGVGGSGLDYAGQMGATQQGQQAASDAEAQMMAGAQQRALAAVQSQGQLAGQVREQDTGATQQAFQDAASRAAGATGQYGTDAGLANARSQRQSDRDQSLIGGLGALLSSA